VFLLVDGRRSVKELVHLSGKNQDEVYGLLSDLVRIGVIRIGEK
jgi:DNA-binding IclR family transcriptional regulator